MVERDFSLKKDILQLQKKVTDLELTATELNEALTKFDTTTLDDLKQRVEDIEDLTMVENAAVIELKKMLEGTKPEQTPETISPQLEEKLKSLEEKVQNITTLSTADTSKPGQDITNIKEVFDSFKNDLENKVKTIETRFSSVGSTPSLPDLSTLKEELKTAVLASMPDYNLIRNDVQSVIQTFKSEFEKEKEGVESALDIIKSKLEEPLPQSVIEKLGKITGDLQTNNMKVEAVQQYVENFHNELNQLRPLIIKLETFERLMDLHEEVSEKLQAFKEVENTIKDSIEINAEMERHIQREADKFKNFTKDISRIDTSLSKLSKDVSSKFVKRDELKSVKENLNLMTQDHETLKRHIDEITDPLKDRISSIERNISDIQDTTMGFDKRIDSTEKILRTAQDDMSVFQGNLMVLEQGKLDLTASVSNLQEVAFKKQPKSEMSELVKKIDSLNIEIERIKSLNPDDKTNELVNKINELESKIESVRSSTIFDEQLSEIISRLVFLESRLAGMEGVMQDMPRYSPIVVE